MNHLGWQRPLLLFLLLPKLSISTACRCKHSPPTALCLTGPVGNGEMVNLSNPFDDPCPYSYRTPLARAPGKGWGGGGPCLRSPPSPLCAQMYHHHSPVHMPSLSFLPCPLSPLMPVLINFLSFFLHYYPSSLLCIFFSIFSPFLSSGLMQCCCHIKNICFVSCVLIPVSRFKVTENYQLVCKSIIILSYHT